MSSTYTVTDYLLDRANIHDTVTKLAWYYDTHSEAGLRDEVFAPELRVDYSKILGGEPFTIAGPDWAAQAKELVEKFDSSQHLYGHFLIDLPQPGSSSRPDKSTVLGQCGASMVRQGASGEGSLLQNGGQATIEVIRLPEPEAKGVNPWRISSQAVAPAWVLGNKGVLEGLHAQGS
ncbi:hypothetical protein INS49_002290 [Diaporthe citri]|uniref:uncharacterized protein n=1 Tax=Diaporthe citri TaxID=83186 RepID=UPI001C80B848|nr:uncharacterized protein INS49_002290 [Diaporthe citri]KAG6368090.1 hypothetical protein INS49_002290 [Diaporthe citri]